jgi:hypothetical protein
MAENFGSALQAFALEHFLIEIGCQPEIINCIYKADMEKYRLFRTNIYSRRLRALVADVLYFSRNLKRKKSFADFRKRYLTVSDDMYDMGRDEMSRLNQKYDVFICGSDQIWNLNCTNEFVSEFFLSFAHNEKRKIAYAPSMPSSVPSMYHADIKKAIERLDFVSVREENTIQYLNGEIGIEKEIVHVVDPTLLLESDTYIRTFGLMKHDSKYIFVYILEDESPLIRQIVDLALETSEETGLQIRYVYSRIIKRFKSGEYMLGIGPTEFLDMIYNASYVITNSFHASVFSIHFEVPFCVFKRKGSQSRMTGLLENLGLQNNLYSEGDYGWMGSKADSFTKEKAGRMARESKEYLWNSLGKRQTL